MVNLAIAGYQAKSDPLFWMSTLVTYHMLCMHHKCLRS